MIWRKLHVAVGVAIGICGLGPAPNAAQDDRPTIRAVRLSEPIRLDGELDEAVYGDVAPVTDFIQQMPVEGGTPTDLTEAWVLFDDDTLYVSARLWESAPSDEWVANEMRRDTPQLRSNDSLWLGLDTFYDRRNAVVFHANPLGGFGDFAVTNEGNPNPDWNPVWDVRTGRFDGGWLLEMAIPFKSLRYRPGPEQIWGLQLHRRIANRNEMSFLGPVPIAVGRGAIFRVSDYATLVGLEPPPDDSRLFELKTYGIAGMTTDRLAEPPVENEWDADAGLDVKIGLTNNLTADLTYNTDFAQVEVDEQQVNLTRFNLFFPEKREFFLEGRGIFEFARGPSISRNSSALRQLGDPTRGFFGGANTPILFHSRQIGLSDRGVVPIIGGGRITGKVGAFDVGAVNIQTDDEPTADVATTNFTVARVKRDILRRSSVGAIFTNRSVSTVGPGSNQVYGADATLAFYDNVSVVTYLARTQTEGLNGHDLSYQGQLTYNGDLYGLQAEHLLVEDNFVPDVGFLRRRNFRRSYVEGRYSPRPRSFEHVRQFRIEGGFDYTVTANTGQLETYQSELGFSTEFESSDRVGINVLDSSERLSAPFEPGPGVIIPPGEYRFADVEGTYFRGTQHRLTGLFSVRLGQYFDGTLRSVGFSRGRFEVTPALSIEPTVSVSWIDTPYGAFRADLVVSRVTYTFTPRMFFSGLTQYNAATRSISSNLRFRWEYRPGSELFVVYSEDQDTSPLRPDRSIDLRSRGLVVKVTRLFRF